MPSINTSHRLGFTCALVTAIVAMNVAPPVAQGAGFAEAIAPVVERDYASLEKLYTHYHAHPELSLREQKTAARLAEELKALDIEVTTGVGGHGVVGVLKNGAGPTILVRADLDALPLKELTGVPYASTVRTTNDLGAEVDVMHACGHDVHITSLVEAARVLTQLKNRWSGTIVFIGQPAEELGGGALAMLKDGLFTRFPKPDFCLALHVSSDLAAGAPSVSWKDSLPRTWTTWTSPCAA